MFYLFGWDNYYPLGASSDCKGVFDTLEKAKEYKSDTNYCYWEIWQPLDGKIVIVSTLGDKGWEDCNEPIWVNTWQTS